MDAFAGEQLYRHFPRRKTAAEFGSLHSIAVLLIKLSA
ncbi:hypothetical protein ACPOL_0355 [Acidisarcina polymorpha]|uniref:Uncharacterized protein n=1 Tax=Acidisarcina polymorpha TaxID=2211140 RepID=A0A2Z5FTB6_9BACT|nr:hypothetical protein ACPOL_0355 [Acidisarcina polymorpha]